jgi:hypothetical protein
MTKDQQQRLERLEARKAAGKPLTRTEKFALMNLSRLRDTQQLLDQMENRQRDPRCICNAGDRHYGNCPLATPENRITGPGE